jgi:hypothetical protein
MTLKENNTLSCRGKWGEPKIKHLTEESAMSHYLSHLGNRRKISKDNLKLTVYICEECHYMHIGHEGKEVKKLRKKYENTRY